MLSLIILCMSFRVKLKIWIKVGVDEGNKMNPLWELMKEIGRYIMGVNEGNR
jgi:hypothetical protein